MIMCFYLYKNIQLDTRIISYGAIKQMAIRIEGEWNRQRLSNSKAREFHNVLCKFSLFANFWKVSTEAAEEEEEGKVLKSIFPLSRCRFLPFSTFIIIRSIFRLLLPRRRREKKEKLYSEWIRLKFDDDL